MRLRAVLAGAVFGALVAAVGCRGQPDTVLVIVATLSGSVPPATALDVTLTSSAGTSENRYAHAGQQPITFPTTLTAELPARITGDITVDVRALDAAGTTLAHGRQGPITLASGSAPTIYVRLDCGGSACLVDGGSPPGPDAGAGDALPGCGNGQIDPGETCDVAIPVGAPGACPPADCDDQIACTSDVRQGDGCTAACTHEEIRTAIAGDGCCPAGATHADDSDCSAACGDGMVGAGETCDTAIAAGAPGACPGPNDCADSNPCTTDLLISAGTCSAICLHAGTSAQSGATADGCCPAGAFHDLDVDCPIACGDGRVDPGESCDVALPPLATGACPASCDDGDPCTLDFTSGAGCTKSCAHSAITANLAGDGCCPPAATRASDSDCPASCGDGVVEPGESCDTAASGPAACPTSCPPSPSACIVRAIAGSAASCTARCEATLVTACSPQRDGCCPAGCTAASDGDCSASCGNGVVDAAAHESCDTAIAAGAPGACPTACSDGDPCTDDLLVSAGTCQAACVFLRVTAFRAGDGCCPPGADFTVDADCAPACGNGVVEPPVESCDDTALPGGCPSSCPAGGACTTVTLAGSGCSTRCVASDVSACADGDGCCPPGCTPATDADCAAVCGDGVVEAGERCDRAITTGQPGACAATCDDGDACTADFASGTVEGCSRACTHDPVTACVSGDGCCPPGCSAAADTDCAATCGDGRVGAGETCDPPSSCPTTCPDDGDRCTQERLVGDPARCTAACRHDPITACSGARSDGCCPTGCTPATDTDC